MWQPEGEKLSNVESLGSVKPVSVLLEQDGPRLFTCKDQTEDVMLAWECGREGTTRRYLLVPSSNKTASQLTGNTSALRDALNQPAAWLADVGADGKVASAWIADLTKLPADALPKTGQTLAAVKQALASAKPAAPPAAVPAAAKPGAAAIKPGKINIERMMHRGSLAVQGESGPTYALLKLIPSDPGGGKGPALNLALVLDVSGSMMAEDGTGISRLKRIQSAAKAAISKLRDHDTIAIVGFAYDAKILLPATGMSEKAQIDDIIDKIDQLGVDQGGTAMDAGIQAGIEATDPLNTPDRLTQVVVLTDGETTGESICRQLADACAKKRVHLSLMGVGLEWNASLIKDLAKLSSGKWYYIDVNEAAEAERVFMEEFESLAAAGFLDVEIHLRPVKGVEAKKFRQVTPQIRPFDLTEPEERHLVAKLGTLERDKSTKYIVDLKVPKRPDGKYVIAQVEVTFDPGNGVRETARVPLEVTYTAAGHGFINAEVARYIDEVQVSELNEGLQKAIAKDNKEEAKRLAEALVKQGDLMGPRAAKKTMLAKQVLSEINQGGRVSKKTQLAMDDVARQGAE